ncbi:MAG TPA: hypothetical protein VK997_04305 [Deferrisomatales bacterium]|nr:hypothetical protein [Deferrisomatales bacterium]
MSKALRGALFSALVFPGVGELMLKSYARGSAFVAVALVCLGALVGIAVRQARTIVDALLAAGGAVDLDAITRTAHGAAGGVANAASLVLVLCWVASVVDAYRIGKQADAAGARRG